MAYVLKRKQIADNLARWELYLDGEHVFSGTRDECETYAFKQFEDAPRRSAVIDQP